MIRLFVAVLAGGALIVVYDRAANTGWAIPLAIVAVVYAVLLTFLEDRADRNLERFERREKLRDDRERRAA